MDDETKKTLDDAVAALNAHGREAAEYLKAKLGEDENEEAASWITVNEN